MKKCFLIILCFISPYLSAEKHQLSILSIFRDEAPYLKEWIEFHRIVGVEHFYLINHFSKDNFQEVLQPYIDAGIVELDHCGENLAKMQWNRLQQKLCRDKMVKIKNDTRWLAVIDIDEFLFPTHEDNLITLLKQYENYAGLCVNWQMYGTSGIEKLEDGELLTERLTWKAEENYDENRNIKSIIKPSLVNTNSSTHSIHFFHYLKGHYAVNENYKKTANRKSPTVNISKIRINHYWTRDKDYLYNKKIPGFKDRRNRHNLEMALEREAHTNDVEDTAIWRFLPELKPLIVP